MTDEDRTKGQPINELVPLRERVAELEASVRELKRVEGALEHRVEFEGLITTVSTNFIDLAPDEIDGAINHVLQAIGEFAGVDRSYVYLFSDGRTKIDNTHEWCARGMEPRIQELKGLPIDELPWALEEIRSGETVHIPSVADLPTGASPGEEHWQWQDIQSLIVVPMIYRGSLEGFLGFDSVQEPKTWAEDIIVLLRIVGEILVNALEHKRATGMIRDLLNNVERIKQEWESTADALPDLVCLVDDQGRILRANRTVERWRLGRVADVKGRDIHGLLHPDCADVSCYLSSFCGQAWERARSGERAQCEAYDEVLKRHMLMQIHPCTDGAKGIAMGSTAVIVQDITERKRMEDRMRGQDRLAAMGQLAAGIAHDFNNILTSMIGFAELVHRRVDVPESAKLDLKRVMEGGYRAANLIRQILDFSRKSLIRRQSINLAPFLREAVRFLQRTIPESTHIVLEMGPDQYRVNADPNQLQQALTNLAVNARDAMPEGGELRFALSSLVLTPDDGRLLPGMEPGRWVALSVSDTGAGISPEVLAHLYEPFYTTKGVGEGTGLGLAQVYGIVKQHEGFIDVVTQVGEGTSFIIYLPALAVPKEALGEEAPKDVPRGRGETVLVVEDEPHVLGACRAMLEHLGYHVLTAANGPRALDLYDRHEGEIALVLADMVMPQMSGLELFQVLRFRNPDAKVVMMTGYPLARVEGRGLLEQGIVDWIQKPLELAQLAQLVHGAL
jgi:two-component system cell cycle sensor histidine kinase/response regulator CckA